MAGYFETDGDLLLSNPSQNDVPKTSSTYGYLWISPEGRAIPGAHHQLILHIIAGVASSFSQSLLSSSELVNARIQLEQTLPSCHISQNDLEAIAVEFANLEPDTKYALGLFEHQVAQSNDVDSSTGDLLTGTDLLSYDQAETELVEDCHVRRSSAGIRNSNTFTRPMWDSFTSGIMPGIIANGDRHVSVTCKELAIINNTTESNAFGESVSLADYNPGQDFSAEQDYDERGSYSSTSGTFLNLVNNMSAVVSNPYASLSIDDDEDVEITPENALLYAPVYLAALAKARFGETSIKFVFEADEEAPSGTNNAENIKAQQQIPTQVNNFGAAGLPGELPSAASSRETKTVSVDAPAGYPAMPKIRRPNPSSYIKHSQGRITVPACEAEAFIAWFGHSIQSVPEKIEGYAWYCDRCYEQAPAGKTKAKGKYTSKVAAERHFSQHHNEKWKALLPEPERETGMQTTLRAKNADRASKVFNESKIHQQRSRVDRRSLEGLRSLDTPALYNISDKYKYQPTGTRRVLFKDEMTLRAIDANTAKKGDGLQFEDLKGDDEVKKKSQTSAEAADENKPPEVSFKRSRHGGKQSAWESYAIEASQSSQRKVAFSDTDYVNEINSMEDEEGGDYDVASDGS